jgi:hypothetical protein
MHGAAAGGARTITATMDTIRIDTTMTGLAIIEDRMATMAVRVTGGVIGVGIAVGTTPTTKGVGEQRRLVVIYYWYPASDVIITDVWVDYVPA